MTRVDLHPRAIFDARAARRYYGRASAILAGEFMIELDTAIAKIATSPQAWPLYLHGTRFCRLQRFPYHLVYIEKVFSVLLLAVAHNRRRPGYWVRRLP